MEKEDWNNDYDTKKKKKWEYKYFDINYSFVFNYLPMHNALHIHFWLLLFSQKVKIK